MRASNKKNDTRSEARELLRSKVSKGQAGRRIEDERRRRLRLSQDLLSITKSLVRNKVVGVARDGIVGWVRNFSLHGP